MKAIQTSVLIILFFITQLISAQKTKDTAKNQEKTAKKSDNLLDRQANVLSSIFGEDLNGKSNGKTIGFLELLEKMDITSEQKLEYKNSYYLQAKKLTQKQKDSLSKVIEKKILEAQQDQ
ncbi:hypothetical protein [Aquimarina sediminis]|uniref:hypothetical protein n=1 Tax=Aquimarina sediminis TaxID=2070536 RepID=UPI000FFEDE6D|nr:hypothetical protein [Aquimarina sediminis]